MKKYSIFLAIIGALSCHTVVAQSWFKVYLSDSLSIQSQYTPIKLIQLTSGDFVLLSQPNYNSNTKPIHLKRISQATGEIIWQTTLNEQPTNNSYSNILTGASKTPPDISPTIDGGFLLTAVSISDQLIDTIINSTTYRALDRFLIMKYNANGSYQWRRTNRKGYYSTPYNIKQNSNGDIVMVGGYSPDGTSSIAVFNIIDPVYGNDIIDKEYGGILFSSVDYGDGYYYCTAEPTRQVYKLNSAGDTVWVKPNPFGNINPFYKTTCLSTADGGCLVNRGDSIARLDSTGVILVKKRSRGQGLSVMKPGQSEKYLFTLSGVSPLVTPVGNRRQICLISVDDNCDSITARYYPDSISLNTIGIYGLQCNDNSLAATGLYRGNLCVFKTNPSGNIQGTIDSIFIAYHYATLNKNNIQASFSSTGNLLSGSDVKFKAFTAPAGSNKTPIFGNGLIIGAKDATNKLHVAAQTYSVVSDYSPGPLNNYDIAAANKWDKIWKVDITQIRNHILDFLDNQFIDNPDPAVFEWPGNMNTYARGNNNEPLIVTEPLAPFVDLNQNGIYEPAFGEYPHIKGDQMLWFVFNDGYQRHVQSLGNPLNVQVTGSAFVYNCPTQPTLYNTVFTEFNIHNKSSHDYHDFHAGQWVDYDLGNFSNDRTGCDTSLNTFYVYNGTMPDLDVSGIAGYGNETVVQTTTFLNRKMTSHATWGYSFSQNNTAMSDPQNAAQYYNYLTGRWADSTLFTYDSTGYGGTQPYPFLLDGNPSNSTAWSECNIYTQAGDRRSMGSTGPYNLLRDSVLNVAMAYTYHDLALNDYPCFDFTNLQQRISNITTDYNYNALIACDATLPFVPDSMIIYTSVKDINTEPAVTIYPNPTEATLFISTNENSFRNISIYNLSGQKIIDIPFAKSLDVKSLPGGLFILELMGKNGITSRKKFSKL